MQQPVVCREELRELFQLDTRTNCNTADLLPDFGDITQCLDDVPLLRSVKDGSVSHVYEAPKQQEKTGTKSTSREM